jgi:hypothetical protein
MIYTLLVCSAELIYLVKLKLLYLVAYQVEMVIFCSNNEWLSCIAVLSKLVIIVPLEYFIFAKYLELHVGSCLFGMCCRSSQSVKLKLCADFSYPHLQYVIVSCMQYGTQLKKSVGMKTWLCLPYIWTLAAAPKPASLLLALTAYEDVGSVD